MPGSWSDYLELRSGSSAPPPSPEGGDVRIYADGSGHLRSVQSDGTDAPIGGGGGSPGGVNNSLQFNDSGSLGGSAELLAAANGIQFHRPGFGGAATISTDGVGVQLLIDCSDGDADNSGGELVVRAGASDGSNGGDIQVTAGTDNTDGTGGNVTVSAGRGNDGDGGEVAVTAGQSTTGQGGQLLISAGTGGGGGGNVIVQGGSSDGNIQLYSGDSNQYVQLDNTGLQVGATALGFFQGAPAAQPALPVTLQDVIDALVALGLVAAT